jgi:hypothetical protein
VLKLTGPEAALALVVAVVSPVVGFVLSEADRRKLGRTPWGLPSIIWAVLWLLSLALGLVLYLFAHRAEVRRAAQGPIPSVDTFGRSAARSTERSAADDFPAYPRPAGPGDRVAPTAVPAPPPDASGPVAASAQPSWQADPSGRFHYRWWSGTEWTSYVATHGQVVVDTSPDQRLGPY